MATQLEIIGKYASDGFEDADGTSYFNDRIATEHGFLGKLMVDFVDGQPTILQADDVVLIKRNFPHAWSAPTAGASVERNPFGFYVFELQALNGMVRYRLLDDALSWKANSFLTEDREGIAEQQSLIATFQLGLRVYSDWEPLLAAPEEYRHEVTTKDLKLVDPKSIPADAKAVKL